MNDEVINQLAAVRETGATNMLDKARVKDIADQCDFIELCDFIEDSSNAQYMAALEEMGSRQ